MNEALITRRLSPAMSDAEIIRQVRAKTNAGAELLYDKYAVPLLLVIIRTVPLKAAAEEVLIESFMKIWNTFGLYKEEEGKLFTWMRSITHVLAIESLTRS